ncbi:MAG: glycoside hydrolase, partial [Parabacteroides sp.]|nr:glycoside hydrolase [Parabacteroides sp.]
MKKLIIALWLMLFAGPIMAQTEPALYLAADKEKMTQWVDSVFDTLSFDERIGQLFMVIADPATDTRNMARLLTYVNEQKIGGILYHKGDPVTQATVTNQLQNAARVPL